MKALIFLSISTLAFAQQASMQERVKPYLQAALAAGDAFVNVSSASGTPNLAPQALATAFGSNLAAQTAKGTPPYTTSLGGISVQVTDSAGAARLAPLIYVSPSQINYQVPAGTAAGHAAVNIISSGGTLTAGLDIQTVAPELFTANGNGQGVVAATAYRTIAPSTTLSFPVRVYQCIDVPGTCVSVPIDPGLDTPVTVTLYATGLRGRSSDAAVTLMIAGQPVTIRSISAADDSGPLLGIDQVVFGLPLALRGSGEVNMILAADGQMSDTPTINVQ